MRVRAFYLFLFYSYFENKVFLCTAIRLVSIVLNLPLFVLVVFIIFIISYHLNW